MEGETTPPRTHLSLHSGSVWVELSAKESGEYRRALEFNAVYFFERGCPVVIPLQGYPEVLKRDVRL